MTPERQHIVIDYFDPAMTPRNVGSPLPAEPITVGEMAICELRLYKVVAVDAYGFCMLVDSEGETIMRHQKDADLCDPALRAWARNLLHIFDEL